MVIDVDNSNVPPYRAATFYSYDPHGNVDTLLQDYGTSGVMYAANNRFKLTAYNYDLVSGKVNEVSYQPHQADAFYHQYGYDAENRIISVMTSTDSLHWEYDASYTYYRHGPLARASLGNYSVQDIDYAYTTQGWLKSVNPSWITPAGTADQYDSDGTSGIGGYERDAYKLNLNYFDDGTYTDFMPVHPLAGYVQGNGLPTASKRNLYNGNIGSMAVNIRQLSVGSSRRDAGPMLYNYGYDQLNRISSMDAWAAGGSFQPVSSSALTDYAERYTYDPNGNILTLNRNGDSTAVSMDQLSYKYIYAKTAGGNGEYVPGQIPGSGVAQLTNQLSSITDAVTGNSYAGDLKSQSALNYTYDAIGELTGDAQQQLSNITWNVYGKILSLSDSGNTISFTYDAAGNRISKLVHGITTWYVRDAQGNVMSVYTQGNSGINSGSLTQAEADLYGSSRLGLLDLSVNCGTSLTQPLLRSVVRGNKLFELTNHLGNVLETVSDKKVQHTSDSSTVDYYVADVINANDYYSFGMGMPVRSYSASGATNYRYGFNGKENDNEVKGTGNQQDYGMRMYDPRVGRFLSVDPLTNTYPWNSPFSYAEGNTINYVDIDGAENGANTAAETPTPTRPVINVDIDPEIINGRSGGALPKPSSRMFDGPINSGAYAPQTKYISQEELNNLIPPNAGAYVNSDGKTMTVYNSSGAWVVSILKPQEPSKEITWVDRLNWRLQSERENQLNTTIQWNVSVHAYEVITNDPSTLSDQYLSDVQRRLLNGNPTSQDLIYQNELRHRKILYEINDKHDPTKPMGSSQASVLPENHQQLWNNRTVYDEKTDTWWSIEGKGKKAVFHRFSGDGNGAYHWSGSTGVNKNRQGKEVKPVSTNDVPVSAKRQTGFGG